MEEQNPTIDPLLPNERERYMRYVRRHRKRSILLLMIILVIGFILIHRYIKGHPDTSLPPFIHTNPNSANSALGQLHTTSSAISFNCLGDAACAQISIQGDAENTLSNGQPSPFRGFADPSIRKDPSSNRLWLAYSWPNVHTGSGRAVPAVDIHLAYSDNGGSTWQYQGPLWPSTPDTNKGGDNSPGYTVHEVANLLPVVTNGTTTWYGARWTYFIPQNGGYSALLTTGKNSLRLEVSQASTPQGLATADTSILGGAHTSTNWGPIDTNLSTLSPEVSNCDPLEPALYYDNTTLYLMLTCFDSGIVVFSTQPTGSIHSWKWKYNGMLVSNSEATGLGLSGADGFTQGELAKSVNGQLLAIMSPFSKGSGNPGSGGPFVNHFGCWVFQVDSLDNPRLAKDTSGNLKVVADITASDLGREGPGSCGYDPYSATGIIMARRHLGQTPKTTTIHQTGVKP